MNIDKYEKIVLRREWEDSIRFEISNLEEFDRGYYEDNPYCYAWEEDNIPLNEEYYENNFFHCIMFCLKLQNHRHIIFLKFCYF